MRTAVSLLALSSYCDSRFCVKQKTAYEMRISDWSSDVCSSDLGLRGFRAKLLPACGRRGLEAKRSPACGQSKAFTGLRPFARSEERRVGKECVSTCRSRWSPYP